MIEFAIVAVPLIALLLAILQTSLIYFVQEALETSVEIASRSVVTGKAQAADIAGKSSGMTAAQLQERFRKAACVALPKFLKCNRLLVEVRSSDDWSSVSTALPTITYDAGGNPSNNLPYQLGNQGSVVMVRLMYSWPVQSVPLLNLATSTNNQRLIVATSVAKSEAF